MFLSCYSFCGELNIHKGLKKLHTPKMNECPKLWGFYLDIDGNLLHILGYKNISQNLILSAPIKTIVLLDQNIAILSWGVSI